MTSQCPLDSSGNDGTFKVAPIMPNIIRVRRSDGGGIGVIIARRWINAYALTAAHVVRKEQMVGIDVFCHPQPITTSASVLRCDPAADLALLRFPLRREFLPIHLSPIPRIPDSHEPCLCIARQNDRPLVVESRVVGTRRYASEPKGLCFLTNLKGYPGRSGSPLIACGFCIGICYGNTGELGIYISSHEIHRFLNTTRFSWIIGAIPASDTVRRAASSLSLPE